MNTDNLQLDALAAERDLRQRIVELATSYRPLRDKHLMALCRKAWEGDGADTGGCRGTSSRVECLFPSEMGDNALASLRKSRQFERLLIDYWTVPTSFPVPATLLPPVKIPYWRQSGTTRAVPDQSISSVTAGTGAGKTESFSYRYLNDLYNNPRKPSDMGVRAIFLYPMNALSERPGRPPECMA